MANYVYLVQSRDGGELNDSEYQVVALTSSVEKAVAAARADFNAKYYFGDKPEYEYYERISKSHFENGAPLLVVNKWVECFHENIFYEYHVGVCTLHDLYYAIVRCEVDDPYYFSKSPKDYLTNDIDSTWLDELNLDKLKEE